MQNGDAALAERVTSEKASQGLGCGWTEIGTVSPMGGGGPVIYSSIEDREGAKEWLINRLLSHLMAYDTPLSSKGLLTLRKDCLGRPFFLGLDAFVPAISFSHTQGRTWAGVAWATGVGS
jgi:hypothetical protein